MNFTALTRKPFPPSRQVKQIFTFTWYIENFHSWNHETLTSPPFALENVEWSLSLYRTESLADYYIGFILQRAVIALESLTLGFELSFLGADGTPLKTHEVSEQSVQFGIGIENPLFVKLDEVFVQKKAAFLPQDTLIVRCHLKSEGEAPESRRCYARTRLGLESKSFVGDIERFSSLTPGQNKVVPLRLDSVEAPMLSLNIFLGTGRCCEGKLTFKIIPKYHHRWKMLSYKLSVLDVTGNKTECAEDEVALISQNEEKVWKCLLFLTKSQIMDRKYRYLPNDVLTVECDCTFATGIVSQEIEKSDLGLRSFPTPTKQTVHEVIEDSGTKEEVSFGALKDDLQLMYSESVLCDVKLRTATETFPAHKLLLCARSPVFSAMFVHDMRESANECVDIPDADNETVQRMLLYMYTDTVEDLLFEPASRLYAVADKYAIINLKSRCSALLKQTLCPSNACDVLVLADMHSDEDLKTFVHNFILRHDKDIFNSHEWSMFMKDNLQLASEVMFMDLQQRLGNRC